MQGKLVLEAVWAAELADVPKQMQKAVRQRDRDLQEAMAELRDDYSNMTYKV